MKAAVVCMLLCLPALILAEEEFDAEARLAEYAEDYPPTEEDFHENHDCMRFKDNKTQEVGPLGAITNPANLWPQRTLYYQIVDGNYDKYQKYQIQMAAYELYRTTRCVRLVENKNAWDRVIIRKCGQNCNSYVGKIGGMQQMCLADWCVKDKGSPMHEFIHALGFQHEHQRPDRDSYVYVNYNNLPQNQRGAYDKFRPDQVRLLTRYDYGSLMHYVAYLGAAINPRQPVMIPRQRGAKLGGAKTVSPLDIAKIQILYGCRRLLDSSYFRDMAGVQ